MENTKEVRVSGGIGFFGLLQLVFIVLKLCGVIEWSWVCVLIPLIAWVGFIAILLIVGLVLQFVNNRY